MAEANGTLSSSRLRRLAQTTAEDRQHEIEEFCELCDRPIPPEHRHLLDIKTRDLKCTCQPCSLLFDGKAAGGQHYRLVHDRRLRIEDMELSDMTWEELRVPVDIAFFFYASEVGRVQAYYPSPMGPTESLLKLEAWQELERENPVLASMEPDVEALLVNRARGVRDHWLVSIDDCYSLVGLIRTRWRGFSGGKEVWEEIGRFFEDLDKRARPANRHDGGKPTSAEAVNASGDEEAA